MLHLVVNHGRRPRASLDVVREMESAVLRFPGVVRLDGRRPASLVVGRLMWELYARGWGPRMGFRRSGVKDEALYLAVLAGARFRSCFPYFALPGHKFLYLFDAWPSTHAAIRDFAVSVGVEATFVSSSQAASELAGKGMRAIWIPEGVEVECYRSLPPSEKDIDVIQFGRRWGPYHERIVGGLAKRGVSYRYEATTGEVVFPSREAFVDGLARSKISVCFPSSLTHPERAGWISTMTERYLQSMASRCLVVGTTPSEMRDLFGYDPVIEADLDDPLGQLVRLLREFQHYADLIERNYQTIRENHTWDQRWLAMAQVIGV